MLVRQLALVPVLKVKIVPDPVEAFCLIEVRGTDPFTLGQGSRQQPANLYEGIWSVQGFLADRDEPVTLATDRIFVEIEAPRSHDYTPERSGR